MSASYEKEVLALSLFGFYGGEETEIGGSQIWPDNSTTASPEDCVFIKISELYPKHTEQNLWVGLGICFREGDLGWNYIWDPLG